VAALSCRHRRLPGRPRPPYRGRPAERRGLPLATCRRLAFSVPPATVRPGLASGREGSFLAAASPAPPPGKSLHPVQL